jgi:hypothetical protein
MSRIRRLLFMALLPAMVLTAATTASTMGKPQDKVNVCHVTGNGSFHEINISRNALPAHMAHGDVLPDEYGDCP